MKLFPVVIALLSCSQISVAQEEVVSPLLTNPNLKHEAKQKIGNSIDSTFIYVMDTLDLPVWDDFSISKFVTYDADYADGNVTSEEFYHLMDVTNTIPFVADTFFCDTLYSHHDTISMIGTIPTVTTDYFTATPVWVNDLSEYPVQGQLLYLFPQCYVLVDSIIDGVPDPDQDTLWYDASPGYVQDSATVFMVDVNDPGIIWSDNYAYHNYTYAVDPWSLGVATLDGVGADGYPYDFGNLSAHEPADVLTSRPINLAGKVNVYLTFLYQAEGHGNAPEANDSLLLDFWIPDSSKWMPSGWFTPGAITNDIWDTVHWAIPTAALDDGFRFRFRNWASTSGNLDHWHIDYVNLKDNELPTISVFNDLAISEPINTLLKDYTAVPWDHYQNADSTAVMIDTLRIKVFNSAAAATNFANGHLSVDSSGVMQFGYPFVMPNPGSIPGWTGSWEQGVNYYPYPMDDSISFEQSGPAKQAKFLVKANIAENTSGQNLYDVNDTTYLVQKFDNYYAYDDGSAEAAYGITGSHGLLAYKFTSYEIDTLAGVLMHFMPSVQSTAMHEFLLTVWDDNAGQPGNIIYQDDYFTTHNPEYSGALNGFRYFEINDGFVVVPPQTTFYVGWEQIDANSLNIGLDLNIDNGDKMFRNVTGTWQTSSQNASLLMRPVFSTHLNATLSEEEIVEEEPVEVVLYPNPTQNTVNIKGVDTPFTASVYDMTGRLVYSVSNETLLDVSEFTPGIYIVDIRDENGLSLYSGKLIKE